MARYFGCEFYSDGVGSCRFAGNGGGRPTTNRTPCPNSAHGMEQLG